MRPGRRTTTTVGVVCVPTNVCTARALVSLSTFTGRKPARTGVRALSPGCDCRAVGLRAALVQGDDDHFRVAKLVRDLRGQTRQQYDLRVRRRCRPGVWPRVRGRRGRRRRRGCGGVAAASQEHRPSDQEEHSHGESDAHDCEVTSGEGDSRVHGSLSYRQGVRDALPSGACVRMPMRTRRRMKRARSPAPFSNAAESGD